MMLNDAKPANYFAAALILMIFLFIGQCNKITNLKNVISEKESEIKRQDNNYKASLDTVKQFYDTKTGALTATIRGYELTVEDLKGKYSSLFKDFTFVKNKPPVSIIEKQMVITEKISNLDSKTFTDAAGNGTLNFSSDTIFSDGNSRKIYGKFPFRINLFSKEDSSAIDYESQNFVSNVMLLGSSTVDLQQEITVYTGIVRDRKTGELTVWAKTKYPGVNFTVLKGASVEQDAETKKSLVNSRKQWGLGFATGVGFLYDASSKLVYPGIFVGIGLTRTPKKLQFGK